MKYYTYTLKIGILNFLSIILFFLCFIFVSFFYGMLKIDNFYLAMLLSVLYLMFHEFIHYIGFIINKEVDSKNVIVGAELEKGVLYCMCKQIINKKSIIISVFASLFIIGFITLLIGMLFNLDILIFLSIINITGSIGDIIMGIFILFLPKDIKYLDLDDCTSFTIISKENLSNKSFIGIKLIDKGNYFNTMKAKNFKKFNISNFSYIVLFILIVFSLILIML